MIILWNQKEVFVGNSLEKFDYVRHVLDINNIQYKYKLVDKRSPYLITSRRSRMSSIGERQEYSNMYYVYVHRRDFDRAMALL